MALGKTSLKKTDNIDALLGISQSMPLPKSTGATGAPSKAHTRQLVKIQHEERLATTSELNPTPSLATD